jgi:recombination protein RecA
VMFGNPETTTGGHALKFYASVRLDIRRIGAIKQGDKAIGNRTKVKIVKNKLAPPFREIEFDMMYGEGISKEGDMLDLASEMNLLEKSGAWFAWKGERIGQGRENAKEFLKNNPETALQIEHAVLEKCGITRGSDGMATAIPVETASEPTTPSGSGKKKEKASEVPRA